MLQWRRQVGAGWRREAGGGLEGEGKKKPPVSSAQRLPHSDRLEQRVSAAFEEHVREGAQPPWELREG